MPKKKEIKFDSIESKKKFFFFSVWGSKTKHEILATQQRTQKTEQAETSADDNDRVEWSNIFFCLEPRKATTTNMLINHQQTGEWNIWRKENKNCKECFCLAIVSFSLSRCTRNVEFHWKSFVVLKPSVLLAHQHSSTGRIIETRKFINNIDISTLLYINKHLLLKAVRSATTFGFDFKHPFSGWSCVLFCKNIFMHILMNEI